MKGHPIPEITGQQLYQWAVKLTSYLRVLERAVENPTPKVIQLEHAKETASAARDGVLMWDSVAGAPIVSKGGEWYAVSITPVVLAGLQNKATR